MSGIVGIVNWNGTPVDRRLLHRMTESLSARGPDAQGVWLDGPVGLGHAWLRTWPDSAPDPQPYSLDGCVWIVGDVRIDGRADLVSALSERGCRDLHVESDAGVLLHAYQIWGEACLAHVRGDFVFAIWDARCRRLFCARDQFGVKPFFYAQVPNGLVFSNTLACVRLHPAVPSDLNEDAIGDFLVFGAIQDPSATCFAAIHRLPAAHGLAGSGRVHATRYWTLPIDGSIRYRRMRDYVHHFGALLERAVADRARGGPVGVLMSGGLDSTAIAATVKHVLGAQRADAVQAYTTVCDEVLRDPEREFSQLAADALGLPIRYRIVDHYQVYERWETPELRRPEPESDPLLAVHVNQLQDVTAHGRVVLTGYGADPAFRVPVRYAGELVVRGKLLRLAGEVAQYVLVRHRLPRVRMGALVRRWLGRRSSPGEFPVWLNRDFAARGNFHARWQHVNAKPAPVHPTRPDAYHLLTSADWPFLFEGYDPGVTGVPVEARHPFFDLRLVDYLLAIPPMPWCFDKTILRLVMRGLLPDAVRLRPKTVAPGDPLVALLRRPGAHWVDRFEPVPALRAYVDPARIPPVCGEQDPNAIWMNLRPLGLNLWLQSELAS